MRALRPLVAVLCLAASPAGADGWRVGVGPDVFAEPSDAPATRVGGWFDASFEDSSVRPSTAGFNHVNGFADTRWHSFQGFVEAEYEHETSLDGYRGESQFELEQAYVRWQPSEAIGVRAGRFNTPFGWWVPIHWSILMDSVTPPIYVGEDLVPEQQVGAELAGRLFPHEIAGLDSELNWSLFTGYGAPGLETDRTDGFSVGGDLRLRLAERYLLGVSAYRQRNDELDDRSELDGVVYGEALLPCAFTLRSEYVFSHRDPVDELKRNAESVYASVRWDAHRLVYLAYRFGYGDDDNEEAARDATRVGETDRRTVHTVTLGVLPRPDVRVKLEYDHNRLQGDSRPSFDHWALSVGYLF